MSSSDTIMCFVLGMGRSGTTLLSQLLNANPACIATPERQFTLTFYQKYAHQQPLRIAEFAADIKRYYQTRSPKQREISMWQFDSIAFEQSLHQIPPPTYAEICRSFLRQTHYLGRSNETVQCIIDKNPNYTLYTTQLLELFPDAKFIVTLRDYRAVLNSHLQAADNRYTNTAFLLLLWRKHYQHLLQASRQMPDRFLWLPYEALIADQAQSTRQICHFLGIAWHEKMLHAHENLAQWVAQHAQHPDISERKRKKWNDLVKPIYTTRHQAWRQQLTPQQIEFADFLCGTIGQQLHYQPEKQTTKPRKIILYFAYLPSLAYAYIACFVYARYYHLPLWCRLLLMKYLKLQR